MSAREYLWGVELSESNKVVVWDPEKEDEDDNDLDEGSIQHFLFLKQAVLGIKAKEGERNIVEIAGDDFDGNPVTQPLFSLKLGLNESTILDVGTQPPLTLKLISGSGPVCLTGQHALELKDDDFDLLDDEAIEDNAASPAQFIQKIQNASKKRPASATVGPAKKAKLDKSGDAKTKAGKAAQKPTKDDEDDEDDEDDVDFSIGMDDDEEGMSSGDDDEAQDDSGDEDESDEDESDESDESPVKPNKKSGRMNGSGPKGQKKGLKQKDPSLDSLKKFIMQSPNKPKKQAKFINFVKGKFNLQDDNKANELWTWYKTILKD